MAFVGERHRLEGDISGERLDDKNSFINISDVSNQPRSCREHYGPTLPQWGWCQVSPGRTKLTSYIYSSANTNQSILQFPFILIRKLDAKGRQQIKKDCDEVFPQIIIGTGDCIKDVSFSCNQWKCSRCPQSIQLKISKNFLFVHKIMNNKSWFLPKFCDRHQT